MNKWQSHIAPLGIVCLAKCMHLLELQYHIPHIFHPPKFHQLHSPNKMGQLLKKGSV